MYVPGLARRLALAAASLAVSAASCHCASDHIGILFHAGVCLTVLTSRCDSLSKSMSIALTRAGLSRQCVRSSPARCAASITCVATGGATEFPIILAAHFRDSHHRKSGSKPPMRASCCIVGKEAFSMVATSAALARYFHLPIQSPLCSSSTRPGV